MSQTSAEILRAAAEILQGTGGSARAEVPPARTPEPAPEDPAEDQAKSRLLAEFGIDPARRAKQNTGLSFRP